MKILTYEELARSWEYDYMVLKGTKTAEKCLEKELAAYIGRQLGTVLTAIRNPRGISVLDHFRGKSIIDLGCGSKNTDDGIGFEPDFCRLLHAIGIDVTGIDIRDNSQEEFKNRRVDLRDPHSLDFLDNHSIDVAHSKALIDSPTLLVPESDLMATLVPQLERVVKPKGVFIYGDII